MLQLKIRVKAKSLCDSAFELADRLNQNATTSRVADGNYVTKFSALCCINYAIMPHLLVGEEIGVEIFVDVVILGAKFPILLARH